MMVDEQGFVQWFRQAGPYINAHRGRSMVVYFSGEAVDSPQFTGLVHDLALLHSLGIRLVLVHGARPQVAARLREAGRSPRLAGQLRVTEPDTIGWVEEAVGRVRIRLESALSMGLPNSPMQGFRLRVASGNAVTARPVGVRDGVDHGLTGEVRKVHVGAINTWLDSGAVVLLPPLGYSPTGETFNLRAEEVAVQAASALRADKLIMLCEAALPQDQDGQLIRALSPAGADRLAADTSLSEDTRRHLQQAQRACRAGVRRVHLLPRREGALLLELFSRDGIGTLLSADGYEDFRRASIDHVGGILELIAPLEADGTLVRRSRERLETEIEYFRVLERDGMVIACAALYPFQEAHCAEVACVAVHPEYRNGGRADSLLRALEEDARKQGLQRLFVLTTRTAHWFLEQGFQRGSLGDLPGERQQLYNFQRNSLVFVKTL